MSDITISLSADRMSKLQEMATGLGTTPAELVRASIENLLGCPEECRKAMDRVLEKNDELHRRLA